MARINIDLDEKLVQEAMALTGARSKREVVDLALRRLTEKGSLYRAIRNLRGTLPWEGEMNDGRGRSTQGDDGR